MPQQQTTFTFVTVYYKYWEWDSTMFNTLREGLLHFMDEYQEYFGARLWEYLCEEADDKRLTLEVLRAGMRQKREEGGHGLVGIIKQSPTTRARGSVVYLEMYYKRGEWELHEDHSELFDEAMAAIENKTEEEEWDEMTDEEKDDAAIKYSKEENLENESGWGVVDIFDGELIAMADADAE